MTPLYRRMLGDHFDRLPPQVRALHDVDSRSVWTGSADVERGSAFIARLLATLFRLPPHGQGTPLTVTFTPRVDGSEIWSRDFNGRRFASVQRDFGGGLIAERVGVVTLLLRPAVDTGTLTLTLEGARFFGLPLPRAVLPIVSTRESERGGRYHFDVAAILPIFGLLVRYTGTLQRV